MTQQSRSTPPLFTQVAITTDEVSAPHVSGTAASSDANRLLREILAAHDRQNELLEELINQVTAGQRQRSAELSHWKQANPQLARSCRNAADALGRVHAEFLESMTRDIQLNAEDMLDGEFVLNEFMDKYGTRMAQLHGVLQLLTQLGSAPQPSNSSAG
jgi:hypothetical protein